MGLNPKCFQCGNDSVWAGENRYLCENGCTAFGPHKALFLAVVAECRKKFVRDVTA